MRVLSMCGGAVQDRLPNRKRDLYENCRMLSMDGVLLAMVQPLPCTLLSPASHLTSLQLPLWAVGCGLWVRLIASA
jgi:hypothetical protein